MPGTVYIGYGKKFPHRKGCQPQAQAAEDSGSVTIPEGIYKMCRCGMQKYGRVGSAG